MDMKDFLQLYCEIISTSELLNKLSPKESEAIFKKLSDDEKENLAQNLKSIRQFVQSLLR